MKNLIEIIKDVASISSFTNHEDLLHPYIENFLTEFVPNHTITKVCNGLIIEVPGALAVEPIALSAHLDKIDHDKIPVSSDFSMWFGENNDSIKGRLDDAVGVGMCLYMAAKSQTETRPPLLILLSDREELGGVGAAEISAVLLKRFSSHDKFLYPKWILNLDLSERVPKENGVCMYVYGQNHDTNPISSLVKPYFDFIFDSDGLNDYTIYHHFMSSNGTTSVVSINARCENLHSTAEIVKKADIEKVSNIVEFLLDFPKRKWYI